MRYNNLDPKKYFISSRVNTKKRKGEGGIMRAVLVVILATATSATGGSIVSSFISPARTNTGLAYEGGYLYLLDRAAVNTMYITTTTGSVVRPFHPSLNPPAYLSGIEKIPTGFWLAGTGRGIYHTNNIGQIQKTLTNAPGDCKGLAFDGAILYYAKVTTSAWVYRLNTNGSVVGSFPSPGARVAGLDYDLPYIWLADDFQNGKVYLVDRGGKVIFRDTIPGVCPRGVAWGAGYLWVTAWYTRAVYKVEMPNVALAPASLGRVKALYR